MPTLRRQDAHHGIRDRAGGGHALVAHLERHGVDARRTVGECGRIERTAAEYWGDADERRTCLPASLSTRLARLDALSFRPPPLIEEPHRQFADRWTRGPIAPSGT